MEDFRRILDSEEFAFRFDVGVATPSHRVKLGDRTHIIRSLAAHFTIYSVKAELDQLREGLSVMGVLQLLKENAPVMCPLLLSQKPRNLTAEYMIQIFDIKFSPQGSNRREEEEEVSMRWIQYLQMIEGKVILHL